jgi:hypothetical protein
MKAMSRWWASLAACLLIGLTNAFALLGWSGINPANLGWVQGDPATVQIGWTFFRYETGWHWPLTWSDRLGYPLGESVSQVDLIPLAALLLRPLSSVLPEPFQYLGLYVCVSFILQAYFALRLCDIVLDGRPLLVLGGALLLVGSPAVTWRLFGHFALTSHWLILASLFAYFRDPSRIGPSRWMLPFFVVVCVAGAINPYLGALCLLLGWTAVARLLLERRCSAFWAAGFSLILMGLLATSLVAAGFITSPDGSSYEGAGYGYYSMNLLAPIDPEAYRSIVLPRLPAATGGQYEGYNYLGLGVLFLLGLNLLLRPQNVLQLINRKTVPLLIAAALFTAAAASSTMTLGSWTVIHFEVPRALRFLIHSLRSSGRLFWPTHYLLILVAIVLTARGWRSPWSELLILGALLLQGADLADLRAKVRERFTQHIESPLRSPQWHELTNAHDHLFVLPAWQCDIDATPGGRHGYAIFGMLAATQRMGTNSYYSGRMSSEQFRRHCQEIPAAAMTGDLDPKTAYVVNDDFVISWGVNGLASHRCEIVDGFNLCTSDPTGGGPGPAWLSRVQQHVPVYRPGEQIDFTSSGNAKPFILRGWSQPETWGTWTEGSEAGFLVRLDQQRPSALDLAASVHAFVNERHPNLDVAVSVNRQPVARWNFTEEDVDGVRHAFIPADVVGTHSILHVEFAMSQPARPASLGLSNDTRLLGIGVRELSFTDSRR